MQLKDAADSVLGRMSADSPTYQFDPAIILIIIQAIETLLPMLIDQCDTEARDVPDRAREIEKGETLGDRIRWRAAYRKLRHELGRDFYVAGGPKLLDALLQQAAATNSEDVIELWCSMR